MPSARPLRSSLLASLCLLLGLSSWAQAAPGLRFQTDLRGDVMIIGNTVGFDCRTESPDPLVGTIDRNRCFDQVSTLPSFVSDPSIDVFFRVDDAGQLQSGASITREQASSVAMLQLPDGASVAYARLYWSGTETMMTQVDSQVVFDRPGVSGSANTLVAAGSDFQRAFESYQGTADVTSIVQKLGSGTYRLTGAAKLNAVDRDSDNNYVGWGLVIVYKRDSERLRSVSVWDGLTFVTVGLPSNFTVRGFAVPTEGPADSKLGVIAYETDHDKTGDTISFKGTRLSDGESGSDLNFFNGTRTRLGQPQSAAGDLPRMSGQMASMQGIDLDVVDITSALSAGDTSAAVDLSAGNGPAYDTFYLGALVTAITSKKPILDVTLTVPQGTSPLPGDSVEYTVTVRNVGDDAASNVVIEQKLPPGLSYVADSVRMGSGSGSSFIGKTDGPGDDEVDYDAATGTLRIRIGAGASATAGGTLSTQDAAVAAKFVLRVADTASGPVKNQVAVAALAQSHPDAGPSTYLSTNAAGAPPSQPTVIVVRECSTNFDCTINAPVCDASTSPHRCTDACSSDNDCQNASGGKDVCGEGSKCAQCSATKKGACQANGQGSACLASGLCGCMSDADCGGRACNLATNTCPNPSADLAVLVSADPDPADISQPLTAKIAVNNKGSAAAPSGIRITFQVPMGGAVGPVTASAGWRCTPSTDIIRCVYNRPIAVGATTPEIQVAVTPLMPGDPNSKGPSQLVLQANVTSDVSVDPNPADNEAKKTVQLGRYRVAGGGFGCQVAHGSSAAGLFATAALLLLSLLARRRRG
jgi:uncharacterized repeat protein (TIGR01451 family)